MGRIALVMAFVVAACGTAGTSDEADTLPDDTDSAGTTAPPSTSFSSTTVGTATTAAEGGVVTVTVSGWVHEDQRGIVVCPGEGWEGCPGIPLDGDGSLPQAGHTTAVTGSYNGISLTVHSFEEWTPYERGDLASPCTGETERSNPPSSLESEVQAAIEGHADRVAGFWVAGGDAVIGLTGADDELAAELRAIDDRICVDTGYTMSETERQDLTSEISLRLLLDEGAWILESWDGAVDGPIRIRAEKIDTPTRQEIAGTYGDVLELTSYIEVHDAPLSALPEQQPPVPADVEIPKSATRGGGRMAAAWGGVVLEFDSKASCLYVGGDGEGRTVVVWPFGYSVVSGDPTIVYDPAGNEVARTGVPVDLGGGSADLEVVDPALRCNAEGVFQMAGPTQRELDVLWPESLQDPEG